MRWVDLTTRDAFEAAMAMGILADLLAIAVLVLVVVLLRNLSGVRTCELRQTFDEPTTLKHMQEYECSKCGGLVTSQVLGEWDDKPRYCSACGRKVVER